MSKTLFATTAILMIVFFAATAQNVIGVVEYVKVDDQESFIETEKEWQKIYKDLIKSGDIVGCSLYQVLYKTKEDPYNYIKILWLDSFTKINFKISYENFLTAYPRKDEEAWKDLQQRTKLCKKVTSSGVFQQQLSCSNGLDHLGKFYRISEINIKPGESKRYMSLIKDIYLPVYQEDVKNSNRTAWSVWAKWTGSLDNFQYTTADGYIDLDDIEQDKFSDYFKKVHPDKDMAKISGEMKELSVLVNSEMWKLIFRILE